METPQNISLEKVGIKAGIITCFAYISYFIFMKYANLIEFTELRSLNFVIMLAGLYFTFRYYRLKSKIQIDYFKGILLGIVTSIVSVILFAIFIFIYFKLVDTQLLQQLKNNTPLMGQYLTCD